MNESDIREAILKACLWLSDTGMVLGTWGNVSVRLNENRIMLTPSRIDYAAMQPEDLVVIDCDGNKISGDRNPTSEMHVHRLIYNKRSDVNAVVHCHPRYASAMCAAGEGIPPILEEMSQLIGGGVPLTAAYVPAGQHMELASQVVKALGDKNAVLIRNHAPVCCGSDLNEALVCCQLVEKAAACYIAVHENFAYTTIPKKYVASERDRFLHHYGKEHS